MDLLVPAQKHAKVEIPSVHNLAMLAFCHNTSAKMGQLIEEVEGNQIGHRNAGILGNALQKG